MVECKLQDVGQECDIEKLLSDHELIGEGKKILRTAFIAYYSDCLRTNLMNCDLSHRQRVLSINKYKINK